MEQKLQLIPLQPKSGVKYIKITLTDLQFHTAHKNPTSGKSIAKSLESHSPGRIYMPIEDQKVSENEHQATLQNMITKDPALLKTIQDYERQGYKVIIEIPHELPINVSKDMAEFIESKNGKRILRGLAKEKPES